ncbi:MAG: Hsp70 family protein [Chloroflexota bacterium]
MTKIIGIDLGTTNSAVAVIQEGQPTLLPIDGKDLLPSVVGISPTGDLLVGTAARNQWMVAPENTIRSIKRKMGSTEVVSMAGETYTPQQISAEVLKAIKQAAETALGETIDQAVITVPAYFNEVQRQATMEAGELAGFMVERIINEPTAAALAYGYGVDEEEHLNVMVYDLGGGTFDISIIEMNYGVVDVIATAGDNNLGGDDFDIRLAELVADEFEGEYDIDLRESTASWNRLLDEAEATKIALSSDVDATMSLEFIAEDARGNPLHIEREIERHQFIAQIDDLLDRTVDAISQALDDANLNAVDIDRVLLVGGSTRIPAVWEMVSERMEQDPHAEIDPDAAVALGAAVQAGIIAGEDINAILVDVTPLSLGIDTATTSITGELLIDRFAPIIRRNSTIPITKSQIFTTLYPGQTKVHINVYQGENPVASQNVLLGEFMVEDLVANREDGLAEITVNFQIDVNGILNVTVTDRASGKQVIERLKADHQMLSPDQIAEGSALPSAPVPTAAPSRASSSNLDAGTQALIERAEAALGNPDLSKSLAQELRDTIMHIRQAAEEENEDLVEEYSDELIDLLFDAEE